MLRGDDIIINSPDLGRCVAPDSRRDGIHETGVVVSFDTKKDSKVFNFPFPNYILLFF